MSVLNEVKRVPPWETLKEGQECLQRNIIIVGNNHSSYNVSFKNFGLFVLISKSIGTNQNYNGVWKYLKQEYTFYKTIISSDKMHHGASLSADKYFLVILHFQLSSSAWEGVI